MTLPAAVFDRLTRWLDGYAGSPEEPQLRTMLAEVRAQQFAPISVAHPSKRERGDVGHTAAPACGVSESLCERNALCRRPTACGDDSASRVDAGRRPGS